MSLPFRLEKVEDFGPDWNPELKDDYGRVEYLVEHRYNNDKKSKFAVGVFSWVRDRFYNFYSGMVAYQLSQDHPKCPNPDWKRFKNVWRFYREDHPLFERFIEKGEFEI